MLLGGDDNCCMRMSRARICCCSTSVCCSSERCQAQRREREARLMTGDAVAASIAHELREPLTAMVTTADAGLRFIDRSLPNLDKAKEAFKRIAADGHRAGRVIGRFAPTSRATFGRKSHSASTSSSRKRLPWRAATCRSTGYLSRWSRTGLPPGSQGKPCSAASRCF